MDKNSQILIAAFLIIALISGAALFFYLEAQKDIKAINSLKPQIDSVTVERIGIIKNMEFLKTEQERLVSQLKDYGEKIKSYEAEASELRRERENVVFQLTESQKEYSDLTSSLNVVLSQELELKNEIAKAESSRQDLLDALEYAGAEKSELEERLKACIQKLQGVQLPKIVVKVTGPAEGNIIEVSKKYNFSVADLGETDGVKSGDVLEIYRGNKLIAKALIENVYDDMSSIVVFDQWSDVDILIGDTVKLQRS
jgi:predicted RNase H-like nuclease (RuvC/YqgF family)